MTIRGCAGVCLEEWEEEERFTSEGFALGRTNLGAKWPAGPNAVFPNDVSNCQHCTGIMPQTKVP